MILAKDMRSWALEALEGPCMLRLCRQQDALFVTDAPRRAADPKLAAARLTARGFTVREDRGLFLIDPSPDMWGEVIAQAPREPLTEDGSASLFLRSLCIRLLKAPLGDAKDEAPALRILLKAADLRDEKPVLSSFPPMLAALLREKRPLPGGAGRYLTWAVNHHIFSGEEKRNADRMAGTF